MINNNSRKRSYISLLDVDLMRTTKKARTPITHINSAHPDSMASHYDAGISLQAIVTDMAKNQGYDVEIRQSLSVENFFAEYTEEELKSYDIDVKNAVRSNDVEKIKEFHESGRSLKCSNQFGESLLHLACRRGHYETVSFLVNEARVPCACRDDMGRTPLHDAAWTSEPDFRLIALLLSKCPDLLYMSDCRGHTPIAYARRSHWVAWKSFFSSSQELVVPTLISKAQ
jgi:hypothetical protein